MAVKKKAAEQAAEETPVKKVKKVTKAEPETKSPSKKAKAEANGEDNTVSLASLCEEIGIDPRAARVKLRKSTFTRSEGSRWAWPVGSKELAKIRDYLQKAESAD